MGGSLVMAGSGEVGTTVYTTSSLVGTSASKEMLIRTNTPCVLTEERWPCVRWVVRGRAAECRLFVPEAVAKQTPHQITPDSTMPGPLKRSPLKRPGAASSTTEVYDV